MIIGYLDPQGNNKLAIQTELLQLRVYTKRKSLNNYQYYFGGSEKIFYNLPHNPILIVKAPIVAPRLNLMNVALHKAFADSRCVFNDSFSVHCRKICAGEDVDTAGIVRRPLWATTHICLLLQSTLYRILPKPLFYLSRLLQYLDPSHLTLQVPLELMGLGLWEFEVKSFRVSGSEISGGLPVSPNPTKYQVMTPKLEGLTLKTVGFRILRSGLGVQGFRVQGFRVQGLGVQGFRVAGPGLETLTCGQFSKLGAAFLGPQKNTAALLKRSLKGASIQRTIHVAPSVDWQIRLEAWLKFLKIINPNCAWKSPKPANPNTPNSTQELEHQQNKALETSQSPTQIPQNSPTPTKGCYSTYFWGAKIFS